MMTKSFVCVLLVFTIPRANSTWTPHSLFVDSKKTLKGQYYTHRFLIDRPALIPCLHKNDTPIWKEIENVTYVWNFQGSNITKSSPFVSAAWDIDGQLFIARIMQRRITFWCLATGIIMGDHNEKILYFGHRIEFIDAAFIQTLFAVEIRANISQNVSREFEEFVDMQQFNCQVRSYGGNSIQEIDHDNPQRVSNQKKTLLDTAIQICSISSDCTAVSMDYFKCLLNVGDHTAVYSMDLSITHTTDVGILLEKEDNTADFDIMKQIEKTASNLEDKLLKSVGILKSEAFGTIDSKELNVSITVEKRTITSCLGVAGKLNNKRWSECDLCPSGSMSEADIILPPPPGFTFGDTANIEEKSPNDGETNDILEIDPLSKKIWPQPTEIVCRPCRTSSYSEEVGRPVCLPCPHWHSIPIFGTVKGEGGEWIDGVCPRRGRHHILLQDFVLQNFGFRVAGWFEKQTEMSRVTIYFSVGMFPVAFVTLACVIVFGLMDIAAILLESSEELRPLYLQAAELIRNTNLIDSERKFRAEWKLKEIMKQKEHADSY